LNDVPLGVLYAILIFLLVLSGFFSGSETGLMALNRYRLRHLARQGDKGARRVQRLLDRPDKLLGVILLGNNTVNLIAASIATIIGLRLAGEAGIGAATLILIVVVLIFAEVAPKTVAALYPEKVAFPASVILAPLLKIAYPVVWLITKISNALLRAVGIRPDVSKNDQMSPQELRTAVVESASMIPLRHRRMLVNVLDLEDATVEDIMIPRNEIVGIDLDDDWEDVLKQITHSNFTRLPVFVESIDNLIGILHVKKILLALARDQLDKDTLRANLREMYYVPEHTSLMTQLVQFQENKRRVALVVDEYGDIQGLITLEDLLEEIVGEFTTDTLDDHDIKKQPDGSWLIDASATIRDLNRELNWNLPTDGPKTLNGLLLEQLETIPEAGTSVKLGDLAMTVVHTRNNAVRTVSVRAVGSGPPAKHPPTTRRAA